MPPGKKINATKKEIIQVATRMFLEKGFTDTSVKSICEQLGISTGNLTFHYPTKEHLLAVLVEMLCDFQWRMMERTVDEGSSSLMALCLELPAMASICEENQIAKDFYLSAYTHPMTLEIIRRNDTLRSRSVYGGYCDQWQDAHFVEAENLASGIEYATLMTTEPIEDLDLRISGALGAILQIYNVPEEVRRKHIRKVLQMDYRALGRRVLQEFIEYVHEISEEDLEELLRRQ